MYEIQSETSRCVKPRTTYTEPPHYVITSCDVSTYRNVFKEVNKEKQSLPIRLLSSSFVFYFAKSEVLNFVCATTQCSDQADLLLHVSLEPACSLDLQVTASARQCISQFDQTKISRANVAGVHDATDPSRYRYLGILTDSGANPAHFVTLRNVSQCVHERAEKP